MCDLSPRLSAGEVTSVVLGPVLVSPGHFGESAERWLTAWSMGETERAGTVQFREQLRGILSTSTPDGHDESTQRQWYPGKDKEQQTWHVTQEINSN